VSFVDIEFGPLNTEFIEAYKKGEVQDGTAFGRWMGEDNVFENGKLLYRKDTGGWTEVMYTCDHPKDWEHYWLHGQFEIYLASRGEFALMIERAGYRFHGRNGLTSDTSELPPGELYGLTYWHLRPIWFELPIMRGPDGSDRGGCPDVRIRLQGHMRHAPKVRTGISITSTLPVLVDDVVQNRRIPVQMAISRELPG